MTPNRGVDRLVDYLAETPAWVGAGDASAGPTGIRLQSARSGSEHGIADFGARHGR
jgi:hypothetical protein